MDLNDPEHARIEGKAFRPRGRPGVAGASDRRRFRRRRVGVAAVAAAWAAASCASAPPRQTFHFASDLSPSDAYRCVTSTLRRLGFETTRPSPDERTVVALRRTRASADRRPEWWQITSTVTAGADSATAVESEAGASDTREGPFRSPPVELAGVLGRVAASCQWPAAPSGR